MILYINTTSADAIIIALYSGEQSIVRRRLTAQRTQAEKLLPAIDRLLKARRVPLRSLKKIRVAHIGGSFTSLRIGVITANALAYALKIPVEGCLDGSVEAQPKLNSVYKSQKAATFSVIKPLYDRAPTIGISKKLKL